MAKQHLRVGFTIVELLVVIVVIAILAAISIVAYNGITKKARISTLQSDLRNASMTLENYNTLNGSYPATIAAGNVAASSGTTYQYTVNNSVSPATYCVTATNSNISYYINNTTVSAPVAGVCPGDGANGQTAITNLMTNPSLEVDTRGWYGYSSTGSTSSTPVSGGAFSGANSFQLSITSGTGGNGSIYVPGTPISGNTTYSTTIHLKSSRTLQFYACLEWHNPGQQNAACGTPVTVGPSSWSTLTSVGTSPPDSTSVTITGQATGATLQSGDVITGDGWMLVQGSGTYNYADGNTAGWLWNGSTNLSTSTGSPQ